MTGPIIDGGRDARLDREALARQAALIINCSHCASRDADGLPQAPWVGNRYEPGGIILLARNPSSTRQLDGLERQLLRDLAERPSAPLLQQWSKHRLDHMLSKPWRQWQQGFRLALAPCLLPERTAWLNVVPYTTRGNSAPAPPDLERCRLDHLAPLLQLLRPSGVITRYASARQALARTPGPWSGRPMSLPGIGVSHHDARAVHRTLHAHLGIPRHPACGDPI